MPLVILLVCLLGKSSCSHIPTLRLTISYTALGLHGLHDITGLGMPWTNTLATPGIVYITIALAYNLLLFGLMVGRIVSIFHETLRLCQLQRSRDIYTSLVGTLCVSAAVYTTIAISTLVAVAADTSYKTALLPLLGQIQVRPQSRTDQSRRDEHFVLGASDPTTHCSRSRRTGLTCHGDMAVSFRSRQHPLRSAGRTRESRYQVFHFK